MSPSIKDKGRKTGARVKHLEVDKRGLRHGQTTYSYLRLCLLVRSMPRLVRVGLHLPGARGGRVGAGRQAQAKRGRGVGVCGRVHGDRSILVLVLDTRTLHLGGDGCGRRVQPWRRNRRRGGRCYAHGGVELRESLEIGRHHLARLRREGRDRVCRLRHVASCSR